MSYSKIRHVFEIELHLPDSVTQHTLFLVWVRSSFWCKFEVDISIHRRATNLWKYVTFRWIFPYPSRLKSRIDCSLKSPNSRYLVRLAFYISTNWAALHRRPSIFGNFVLHTRVLQESQKLKEVYGFTRCTLRYFRRNYTAAVSYSCLSSCPGNRMSMPHEFKNPVCFTNISRRFVSSKTPTPDAAFHALYNTFVEGPQNM